MRLNKLFALLLVFTSLTSSLSFANAKFDDVPCLAKNQEIEINNEQVLDWKVSTENQFKRRAHIKGIVTQVLPDTQRHEHFIIQIGEDKEDIIEVIYNVEFGAFPEIQEGHVVQACGDYITSTSRTGKLPPSPAGAIIHWVHESPNPERHESGFLVIEGELVGFQNP